MTASWKLDDANDGSTSSGLIALLPIPEKRSLHAPLTVSGSPCRGRHHIRVCRGIACHVKGSAAVLESLQRKLGILPGEATADGHFSLEVVPCLDACGMAPVIAVNEQLFPGVTPCQVERLIRDLAAE